MCVVCARIPFCMRVSAIRERYACNVSGAERRVIVCVGSVGIIMVGGVLFGFAHR